MLTPADLTDRILGCVVGGAVGDALGAPFEGLWSRGIPEPAVLLSDYAEFEGFPRGQYTDDTQLTVATIQSVVAPGTSTPPTSPARSPACGDPRRSSVPAARVRRRLTACWPAATGPIAAPGRASREWNRHANRLAGPVLPALPRRPRGGSGPGIADHAPGSAQRGRRRRHRLGGPTFGRPT